MKRRFWISGVALGLASLMLGFVIHAFLLRGDYAKLPSLFRPEADAAKYFLFMLTAHLLIGFGMTWMYRRNVPPLDQPLIIRGVSFGIGLAILMTAPMYLIYYAVQPMPGAVVAKQILFDTIGVVLLGTLAAWLNQPGPGVPIGNKAR
jgi:hypothetical protein